jgi:hypothetical protein
MLRIMLAKEFQKVKRWLNDIDVKKYGSRYACIKKSTMLDNTGLEDSE